VGEFNRMLQKMQLAVSHQADGQATATDACHGATVESPGRRGIRTRVIVCRIGTVDA